MAFRNSKTPYTAVYGCYDIAYKSDSTMADVRFAFQEVVILAAVCIAACGTLRVSLMVAAENENAKGVAAFSASWMDRRNL